jgi:general transcription factor IIIA
MSGTRLRQGVQIRGSFFPSRYPTRLIPNLPQPKALANHQKINHEGQRKFACSYQGCSKTFGYKHVLQRHLVRHSDSLAPMPESHNDEAPASELSAIHYITGQHYPMQASTRKKELTCPWPDGLALGRQDSEKELSAARCGFMFRRLYDLRRHLKAAHGFEAETELLKAWATRSK